MCIRDSCTSEIDTLSMQFSLWLLISIGSAVFSGLSHHLVLNRKSCWKVHPKRHHRCRKWKKSRPKKIRARSPIDLNTCRHKLAHSSTRANRRLLEPDVSPTVSTFTNRSSIMIRSSMQLTSTHLKSRRAITMTPKRRTDNKLMTKNCWHPSGTNIQSHRVQISHEFQKIPMG